MQPHLIDANSPLLLEAVAPLAAVLVLRVLPFWSNTRLEEVVVGLQL